MFYQGTVQGGSGASNNVTTSASGAGAFALPATTKNLYLMPSVSGLLFELGCQTGVSFLTTAVRGAQLAGPNVLNGPYKTVGQNPVVSVYNSAGGIVTCKVYSAP